MYYHITGQTRSTRLTRARLSLSIVLYGFPKYGVYPDST